MAEWIADTDGTRAGFPCLRDTTSTWARSWSCKAVTRAEIAAADWSLTPGRYIGVAPAAEDEDFDFEQTIRDIHSDLADLNEEAAALAAKLQENFEGLAV